MKAQLLYRGIPREPAPSSRWIKLYRFILSAHRQLMALAQKHDSHNKQALKWAKMLSSPADNLYRAPSSTPFLASKARFVRSFDIPYSATDSGNFAVAAIPSSNICAAVSGPAGPTFTAVPTTLSSLTPASPNEGTPYLSNTMMSAVNSYTEAAMGTLSFVNGVEVHPSLIDIPVLRLSMPNPTQPIAQVRLSSGVTSPLYWQLGSGDSATGAISWNTITSFNSPMTLLTTVASDRQFLVFRMVSANGTPITNRSDIRADIFVTNIVASTSFATSALSYSLLKSEVLDAGQIGNHRCTAMSMLVTNMAPPLVSGGELVAARCPFSVLSSGSPTTIMTTIKQLPEERYWRSGSIKDGSYSWWLPDDLASYEPNPYPEASQPENVLVAAGSMSDPGGFVRVLITYVFEFYTPVQLFARDYNFTYTPMVQELWVEMMGRPAVSANAGHLALIAGASALAQQIYNWYKANESWVDPLAKAGAVAAARALKPKKRKDGQKPGAPPLPPRPKAGAAQTRARGTGPVK